MLWTTSAFSDGVGTIDATTIGMRDVSLFENKVPCPDPPLAIMAAGFSLIPVRLPDLPSRLVVDCLRHAEFDRRMSVPTIATDVTQTLVEMQPRADAIGACSDRAAEDIRSPALQAAARAP